MITSVEDDSPGVGVFVIGGIVTAGVTVGVGVGAVVVVGISLYMSQ